MKKVVNIGEQQRQNMLVKEIKLDKRMNMVMMYI